MPPVRIGETMRSFGIGIVEASNNSAFTVGTRVNGMFGWSEHYITTGEDLVPLPEDVPLEHFMGLLGLPGATAYHGFMELIDTPKAGENCPHLWCGRLRWLPRWPDRKSRRPQSYRRHRLRREKRMAPQ